MREDDLVKEMARTPILSSTPIEAIQSFASKGHPRTYARGSYLFHQGEAAKEVMFLSLGSVQITSVSSGGRKALRSTTEAPRFLGELGVFGEIPRTASGLALEDCHVWAVGGSEMLSFLSERPEAARQIIGALARQVAEYGGLVDDLLFLDLKGRVAKRLLTLSSGGVLPALTQSDLASLAGGSRENVNRIIAEFIKRGHITRDGRRYAIKDPAALSKLAGM